MIFDNVQTIEIINSSMKIMRERLGVINSEIFISVICSNQFDYTKWREDLWEDLTPHELFERAKITEGKFDVPKGVTVI